MLMVKKKRQIKTFVKEKEKHEEICNKGDGDSTCSSDGSWGRYGIG